MLMPIAALRDPANETPLADSLGLAGCETLIVARTGVFAGALAGSVIAGFIADHMGWRAS